LFRVWPASQRSSGAENEKKGPKKFMPWRIFEEREPCDWKIALKNYFLASARSVAQSEVTSASCTQQNPLQQSRLISQQQQLPEQEREREFPGAGIFLIDNENVFCAEENALVCSPLHHRC
jgi:hypothetical protein